MLLEHFIHRAHIFWKECAMKGMVPGLGVYFMSASWFWLRNFLMLWVHSHFSVSWAHIPRCAKGPTFITYCCVLKQLSFHDVIGLCLFWNLTLNPHTWEQSLSRKAVFIVSEELKFSLQKTSSLLRLNIDDLNVFMYEKSASLLFVCWVY